MQVSADKTSRVAGVQCGVAEEIKGILMPIFTTEAPLLVELSPQAEPLGVKVQETEPRHSLRRAWTSIIVVLSVAMAVGLLIIVLGIVHIRRNVPPHYLHTSYIINL